MVIPQCCCNVMKSTEHLKCYCNLKEVKFSAKKERESWNFQDNNSFKIDFILNTVELSRGSRFIVCIILHIIPFF